MKPLRSVFDLWRLAWLRFQRNTMHPLSPYMPRTVMRIRNLERRDTR